MYRIVRFLYKSFITEEPSLKDKMKPSMECFDSEALIKQQEIVSFKIPPPPFLPKLPLNAQTEYDFLQKDALCISMWILPHILTDAIQTALDAQLF